ncbi:MAG: hypothetical protein Q7J85_14090 [Bacillota bacterium]|nr:hypothetical protein [Bacillota bacterium]
MSDHRYKALPILGHGNQVGWAAINVGPNPAKGRELQHLGLIVLSIKITNNVYLGKLLVESQESKVLLETKLKELNIMLSAAAKELNLHFEVTNCEIMSAVVTHEKKMLFEGSFVLDRKV